MKAIERLNWWLEAIAKRGLSLNAAIKYREELKKKGAKDATCYIQSALSMFGNRRVAYEMSSAIFDEIEKADLASCVELPCNMIRLPHPQIFLLVKQPDGRIQYEGVIQEIMIEGERSLQLTDHMYSSLLLMPRTEDCEEAKVYHALNATNEITKTYREDWNEDWEAVTNTWNLRAVKLALFLMGTKDYKDIMVPAEFTSGKRNRNKPDYLKHEGLLRIVGGRFESALKAYNDWIPSERHEASGEPAGRTVKPHIRAGHFHLYWTGKGREIPKVLFIHPCLVGADTEEEVEIQRTVRA